MEQVAKVFKDCNGKYWIIGHNGANDVSKVSPSFRDWVAQPLDHNWTQHVIYDGSSLKEVLNDIEIDSLYGIKREIEVCADDELDDIFAEA